MAIEENRKRIWELGIKKALTDSAEQEIGKKQRGKQYGERRAIQEKLKKLVIRENNNNFPCVGIK